MKIYTRIVIDMASGRVLEEQSHEHAGAVAQCKGSNKVAETEEEKQLAAVAKQKWQRYQDVFVPLENKLMSRVRMEEDDRAQAKGATSAAVQRQFDTAAGERRGRRRSRGVAPGSGAAKMGAGEMASDRARSDALAEVDTDEAVTDLHYRGLENIIAMGRGQSAGAQGSLTDIASGANRRAVEDARLAYEKRASNRRAAYAAAGYGLSAARDRWGGDGETSAGEGRFASGDGGVIMEQDYMGGY